MSIECPLCGKTDLDPIIHVENADFSSRINRFDVLQCQYCRLAMMSPLPTQSDVEEIYVAQGTFSEAAPNPCRDSIFFNVLEPLYQKYGVDDAFIVKQCRRLVPDRRGQSVLDIGCSTGRLLKRFNLLYTEPELHGIDIDPNARANADPAIKDKIVIGDFLPHEFGREFDIITMRFVIEHLLDFREYLAKAIRLLKPGGLLFLSTPDIDSAQAKLLKNKWRLINDPAGRVGHVFWFTRQTLDHLAKEFGLRIEKCVNRGELIYHLPVPVQKLIRTLFGTDAASGRPIKYYAPRITCAIIFDGWLAQVLGCGECLYAFMRKPSEA